MATLRWNMPPLRALLPACNGLALGVGGVAGILGPLSEALHIQPALTSAISRALLGFVAFAAVAYTSKALVAPRVVLHEASDPRVVPALGAYSIHGPHGCEHAPATAPRPPTALPRVGTCHAPRAHLCRTERAPQGAARANLLSCDGHVHARPHAVPRSACRPRRATPPT